MLVQACSLNQKFSSIYKIEKERTPRRINKIFQPITTYFHGCRIRHGTVKLARLALNTNHPIRIKTGVATWTYQYDFTLFFCLPYKWSMKAILVSTFRTNMKFLSYCYLLRFLTHQSLLPLDWTSHRWVLIERWFLPFQQCLNCIIQIVWRYFFRMLPIIVYLTVIA